MDTEDQQKQNDKSDSAKKRILLAAGPIFAEKGFKAATVREISDAAGVNLASVNYYFGDKQQLYIDAVVQARQMRAEQVPIPQWEPGVAVEEKLHGYVLGILQRLVARQSAPWQVRLLVREVMHPTAACRTLVHDYFQPFLQGLMLLIDEIVECRLPEEKRIQIAFSIVGQCVYYRFAGDVVSMVIENEELSDDDFDIEQLAKHITAFSLAAIKSLGHQYRESNPVDADSTGIIE